MAACVSSGSESRSESWNSGVSSGTIGIFPFGAVREAKVDAARGRQAGLGEVVRRHHGHHEPRLEAAQRSGDCPRSRRNSESRFQAGFVSSWSSVWPSGSVACQHALDEAAPSPPTRGDVRLDHERLGAREGALDRRIEDEVGVPACTEPRSHARPPRGCALSISQKTSWPVSRGARGARGPSRTPGAGEQEEGEESAGRSLGPHPR